MPSQPVPADHSIVEMSAVALSAAIQQRALSCTEVLQAFWGQIDRLNPQVNALVAPMPREPLLAQAAQLDAELAQGKSRGPLHGFPQAPKDISPAAGMVTTKGSPIFKGQVSSSDAVVFERMRAGGALFVARSNSPEFGLGGHTYNPVYGTTRNAFDQSRSAGGSSGGAAVAVALRMLPVADGSDMMGSLRTPAAFNNVYGLRTSVGCVPHGPGDEVFFQQFSVAGPMARDIPDLALLLSVQAGFDSRLPLTHRSDGAQDWGQGLERDFKGRKIAWLGDLGGHLPTEPGLLDTCRAAMGAFTDIGCTVDEVVPDFDLEQLWRAWIDLRSFSVAGANASLYDDPQKRALLKPEALWEMERGRALSGMDIYAAAKVRSAGTRCCAACLSAMTLWCCLLRRCSRSMPSWTGPMPSVTAAWTPTTAGCRRWWAPRWRACRPCPSPPVLAPTGCLRACRSSGRCRPTRRCCKSAMPMTRPAAMPGCAALCWADNTL